jgi:hypothetical protein
MAIEIITVVEFHVGKPDPDDAVIEYRRSTN